MYKVFKFGGASIKDAASIRNIGRILLSYDFNQLVVIFSAMGKVTNMLENLVDLYFSQDKSFLLELENIKNFHNKILLDLFNEEHIIYDEVNNLFVEIEWIITEPTDNSYAYNYDQIVSIGELLSTKIMHAYLNDIGLKNTWFDIRDVIKTDNTYRNAKVDWDITSSLVQQKFTEECYVTQGFIASTSENYTTTLGREGSDFTAAIIAFSLDAKEVVIWKNVPGLMNADPNYFPDAKLLSNVSFDEAIELAFFGAKVIHPKTIQPLKKKGITLRIKSFINEKLPGTIIEELTTTNYDFASYIIKEKQILISISDRDLSFIVENHISQIFDLLATHYISVNMMQNSAVSFSICVDNDKYKIPKLINELQQYFKVAYNEGVSLYTIRNYKEEDIQSLTDNKKIILQQKSRNTLQFIALV